MEVIEIKQRNKKRNKTDIWARACHLKRLTFEISQILTNKVGFYRESL